LAHTGKGKRFGGRKREKDGGRAKGRPSGLRRGTLANFPSGKHIVQSRTFQGKKELSAKEGKKKAVE